MRCLNAIATGALLLAASVTFAGGNTPPADLVQLEREVSLKMAHARDEGFTDPARLRRLSDARNLDLEAEKAMQNGDYNKAEDDFLKVKVILHDLGM